MNQLWKWSFLTALKNKHGVKQICQILGIFGGKQLVIFMNSRGEGVENKL